MTRVVVATTYDGEGEVVHLAVQVDSGPGTVPVLTWEALEFCPEAKA